MTDEQLLTLLLEKLPEDWSPHELQHLRERLPHSEVLREALKHNLDFEARLASNLGRIDLHPASLVKRAARERSARSRGWRTAAFLGIILLAFALAIWRISSPTVNNTTPVASAPPPAEKVITKTPPLDPVVPAPKKTDDPPTEPNETTSSTPVVPPSPDVSPTTPPVVARDNRPRKPWDAVLSLPADQLPKFQDICFHEFPYQTTVPTPQSLAEWIEPVPGKPYRLFDDEVRQRRCAATEGIVKMRCPLPTDGGLRFALAKHARVQIHAYHGTSGVTFFYHQEGQDRWNAYTSTRRPNEPEPQTLFFVGSDEERGRRTELRHGGPLELRWQQGELLLLRGDVCLVRAPLAESPSEVYLHGNVVWEGLELVRTSDAAPMEPLRSLPQSRPAAEFTWNKAKATEAEVTATDGALRLFAKDPKHTILLTTPFEPLTPTEVIFQIDKATPGAGVYLGGPDGEPRDVARVVRNKSTNRLNLVLRNPDDFFEGDLEKFPEKGENITDEKLWVKMVFGVGSIHAWQSNDGLHWGPTDQVSQYNAGKIHTLGIFLSEKPDSCELTLRSLAWRPLPEIAALADAQLLKRVPVIEEEPSYERWLLRATESCPPEVELSSWRRACAVRSLAAGLRRDLAYPVLEALLEDRMVQELPFDRFIALYRELFPLTADARDEGPFRRGLITRFLQRAVRESQSHQGRPYSLARPALMSFSYYSLHPTPVDDTRLIDEELANLIAAGRFDEVREFTEILRFFHFDEEQRGMIRWAEALAQAAPPGKRGKSKPERMKEEWHAPWIERLNKETYNFSADLDALLKSDAIADATRLLMGLDAIPDGLTSRADDRDWFLSLKGTVVAALRNSVKLREALEAQSPRLSDLRLRRAIAQADAEAIELVATQFPRTPAAVLAQLWLGDEALQVGRGQQAFAAYKLALADADASLKDEIQQRMRLAAALMGKNYGTPVEKTMNWGDARIAGPEFEAVVKELGLRAAMPSATSVAADQANKPLEPQRFRLERRSRLDGTPGDKGNEEGAQRIFDWHIDFLGKQLGVAVQGDVAYVNNRFHLAAYGLSNGQRQWASNPPRGQMRRTQDWPLVSMQPLVVGEFVIARQLFGQLPTLCAFQKSSGALAWQRESSDREGYASDPFELFGRYFVLAQRRDTGQWHVQLVEFDPLTGDDIARSSLVELRSSWEAHRNCVVATHAQGFLASFDGLTIHCSAQGKVQWARRRTSLPREWPFWVRQYFQPPVIVGSIALLMEPGCIYWEAVEVETGRRLWQREGDFPHRVVGVREGVAYLETESGWIAVDVATGKLRWQRGQEAAADVSRRTFPLPEDPMRATASVLMGEHLFTITSQFNRERKQKLPWAKWIDLRTGRLIAEFALPTFQNEDPRFGPMFFGGDRWWMFTGAGKDVHRDFVEIIPEQPLSRELPLIADDEWSFPPRVYPGEPLDQSPGAWRWMSSAEQPDRMQRVEFNGEKETYRFLVRPERPLVLRCPVMIEKGKNTSLKLSWDHENGQEGKLRVLWGNEELFSRVWNQESAPPPWLDDAIDLSKHAGQSGELLVVFEPTNGKEQPLWLRRLVIENQ